jgi:hypothetical protein
MAVAAKHEVGGVDLEAGVLGGEVEEDLSKPGWLSDTATLCIFVLIAEGPPPTFGKWTKLGGEDRK